MNTFVEFTKYVEGTRVIINLSNVTHATEESDYGTNGYRKKQTRVYLVTGEDILINSSYERFTEVLEQTLRVPAPPVEHNYDLGI